MYSLLTWDMGHGVGSSRPIAVLLSDQTGLVRVIRGAPLGRISGQLHEQGLLDSILEAVARRVSSHTDSIRIAEVASWANDFIHALRATSPAPAAIPRSLESTAEALYRGLVVPQLPLRQGSSRFRVLDKTVRAFRAEGLPVRRGPSVGDFTFDATIDLEHKPTLAVQVLSFDSARADGAAMERDAGHFLYAVRETGLSPFCVVQPPGSNSPTGKADSYLRVRRWLEHESVPTQTLSSLPGVIAASFARQVSMGSALLA